MRRLVLLCAVVAVAVYAAVALSAAPIKPPSSLTAAAGDQRIALSWQPGGSTGVTGYRVYRQLASGKWPATPLATTSGTTLTYTDTGLTNGTRYTYRVTTLVGSRESKPSATAAATP